MSQYKYHYNDITKTENVKRAISPKLVSKEEAFYYFVKKFNVYYNSYSHHGSKKSILNKINKVIGETADCVILNKTHKDIDNDIYEYFCVIHKETNQNFTTTYDYIVTGFFLKLEQSGISNINFIKKKFAHQLKEYKKRQETRNKRNKTIEKKYNKKSGYIFIENTTPQHFSFKDTFEEAYKHIRSLKKFKRFSDEKIREKLYRYIKEGNNYITIIPKKSIYTNTDITYDNFLEHYDIMFFIRRYDGYRKTWQISTRRFKIIDTGSTLIERLRYVLGYNYDQELKFKDFSFGAGLKLSILAPELLKKHNIEIDNLAVKIKEILDEKIKEVCTNH
jgi:hypothetical protein